MKRAECACSESMKIDRRMSAFAGMQARYEIAVRDRVLRD